MAKNQLVPAERIEKAILLIRGHKVLLDRDLAELYGVPTKVLNQAVRRALARFPADFMFQLSQEELEDWRSQIVTSNPGARMGLRSVGRQSSTLGWASSRRSTSRSRRASKQRQAEPLYDPLRLSKNTAGDHA